ncbi:MAG: hypothetical protein FWC48_03650 [Actinomycetia bacterium]|nr:hypothetical protein [Actinomycetes bacterium]
MKAKKNRLSLIGLWVLLWGLYAGYMFYLAQGGIKHHAYGGLSVKTMAIALGIVSVVLSVVWYFMWRIAHESRQHLREAIQKQLDVESQVETKDADK